MVEEADGRETINERVALFIDVDNVLILAQNSGLPFHLDLIIDRVRQQGAIMSSKAYADWTASLLKPVLSDFRANAIELVQLPTWHTGRENKNTADIQLCRGCPGNGVLTRASPHHRNRGRRPRLCATDPETEEVRRVCVSRWLQGGEAGNALC